MNVPHVCYYQATPVRDEDFSLNISGGVKFLGRMARRELGADMKIFVLNLLRLHFLTPDSSIVA